MLRQKLSKEERRTRSHRLIVWGAVFESIVPEAKNMTDEEAAVLLRLALTSEPAREFFTKTSRERHKLKIPLEQRAHLYTLAGVCALPRALSPHRELPRAPILAVLPQTGEATLPLRCLRVYPFVYLPKANTLLRKLFTFSKSEYPIREVIP